MADGRIKTIEATWSLAGGGNTMDWVVRWYYLTAPGSIKVFQMLAMNYSEFEEELDLMKLAEGVTFV